MNFLGQVVTSENFSAVVDKISTCDFKSFDTETTGLHPFKGHSLFSCIFGVEDTEYYFNFLDYNTERFWQHDPKYVLSRELLPLLSKCFTQGLVFMHNAKFDWHMAAKEDIDISIPVWCTMTGARVVYNDHMKYGLAECAERIGYEKDDAVEQYISKHKLWEWIQIPGKKQRKKNKFYSKVPFNIMAPYGLQDAKVTLSLGLNQMQAMDEMDNTRPKKQEPIVQVMRMESDITGVCKDIENVGIKIDRNFCQEAIQHEDAICQEKADKFYERTGLVFKDSGKLLSQAFCNLGLEYPLTAKGNPCFNDAALEPLNDPLAQIIKGWRTADKRANTYFRSYLYFADADNVIHADMRQAGTATGRFSYIDPNLQNIPKSDESEFPVRKAFVPREDFCFVAIDYDQMEFRLMLDYAEQLDLIEKIKAGYDPHTATSELVGIERRPAKILNFGLLYGMGVAKLAQTLGCTEDQARQFKRKYFSGLGGVKVFLNKCTRIAEKRGFVFDWAGRRFYFPDRRFAYKAANGIIQGGCSSIVKKAMINLHEYLQPLKSRMLLQIHDEILFEVHKSELDIVHNLRKIMEATYPYNHLPMSCSVEHSWKSFGELEKGEPNAS